MKRIITICLCVFALGKLIAQPTINDANAEVRNVGSFHGVKVASGIELVLTEGKEQVAVSANSTEYRDKIQTKVENGILSIYYDNKNDGHKNKGWKADLKAYVSYSKIDLLDASSGSSVKISGVLKSSAVSVSVSSGATIKGDVNISSLTIDQSSGSVMNLSGSATTMKIGGSSGSNFKGFDLKVDNVNATVSSGAQVSIQAEKELEANASSGGNVRYKGNAVLKNLKTSSGGSVNKS